jgi:hypothetical protein
MSKPRSRPALWKRLAALAVVAVLVLAGASFAAIEKIGVPPRLLGPYVQQRSTGHHALIETAGRLAGSLLTRLDRGTMEPRLDWPEWLAPVSTAPAPRGLREVLAADVPQLRTALANAQPGDVITLAPGRYRVEGSALTANRPGRADAPVTVRAPRFGQVTLQFNLLEGFHVLAPHWIFENLVIEGVCADHGSCEHAFHVVGDAQSTVIRNNELRDFNAQIKINGDRSRFPDGGRISGNRIYNRTPRRTANPVTPIDLVAASRWTIDGNLIADFVKDGGDFTSYGAFAKGAGEDNRFLGNVVLCEHRLRGAPGRRVGLSFGGGGSGAAACRDGRCAHDHDLGTVRDNLIASCSDAGVYLNRAVNSRLEHNTILDTAGIQARAAGELISMANLVDGPMRLDASSYLTEREARTTGLAILYFGWHPVRHLFADATKLDLVWAGTPPRLSAAHPSTGDLCGPNDGQRQLIGSFEDIRRCMRRAAAP